MKRTAFLTALAVATALALAVTALGATILSNPTHSIKLAYAKKNLAATAGLVTIRSKNMSAVLKHNIALRKGTTAKSKLLVKGKVVGKGGVSKVSLKLAKGKYRFVCTVPGHELGGMWGILTVK
ncbi:MAG TPA: plastocyanin/azurin family copper-binding protein [Gaiellaceae bacterium]|nr:plastocyanin/azurin family copper-binding protein [Gaiellaceae bacterium]